jgi:hypothetical protein
MIIAFGLLELADGNTSKAAGGLRVSTSGVVQVSALIRSRNARSFNRKNYRTQISFAVERLAGSLGGAENLVATMAEAVKDYGTQDLRITFSDSSGTRYLKNAQLISCDASYRGLTVHFEYSFSGEYMTVS